METLDDFGDDFSNAQLKTHADESVASFEELLRDEALFHENSYPATTSGATPGTTAPQSTPQSERREYTGRGFAVHDVGREAIYFAHGGRHIKARIGTGKIALSPPDPLILPGYFKFPFERD